jgi:hypothetical protein
MKISRRVATLFLVLASLAVTGWAVSQCQAEFDQIKSLAGDWEGKSASGTPVHINYKVVSGGTAVMESIVPKSESEMVTVYYLDGDYLMMTHYCMANNQPRMRADAATSSRTAIKFAFVDATNLASPDAGHMHAHSIIWKDADHVRQEWTWRDKGQEKTEAFELQRQK